MLFSCALSRSPYSHTCKLFIRTSKIITNYLSLDIIPFLTHLHLNFKIFDLYVSFESIENTRQEGKDNSNNFFLFAQIYLWKNKCKMIKEKELSHLKEWFGERFNWRIVWWSIRRNEGAMENFLFVTSQNVEGIISS